MKTLLILRHGKSSWKNNSLADHDRPLKKRGERDADQIGQLILQEDLTPDIIVCSTAKRAKDTAKIVADSCGFNGEVLFLRSLYHGYPSDLFDLLINFDTEKDVMMLVGHNPGLEEFLSILVDGEVWMSTAALAQVELDIGGWSDLRDHINGTLINLWRPRELGTI